jgi:endonuclease/exonuclease/phosphatase (EEP) superfamily protein YafD
MRFNKKKILFLIASLFLVSNIIVYLFAHKIWISTFYSAFPPISYLIIYIFISLFVLTIIIKEKQFKKASNIILMLITILNLGFLSYFADINLGILRKDKELTGNEIKVFNWNTEFWENDREKLYSFLKEQNADIYQLQERLTPSALKGEFKEIDDLKELKELFPEYSIAAHSEYITISKYPIRDIVYSAENSFLRTDISINNKTISFYNVHLPVHIDLSEKTNIKYLILNAKDRFEWRSEEFKKLENDLNSNNNIKYISGDFNSIKSMGTMRNLLKKYDDSAKYSNRLILASWSIFGIKGWRIDYTLTDKAIEIVKHEDIDPNSLSDHWGQKVYAII